MNKNINNEKNHQNKDQKFMKAALEEAKKALQLEEVPIGAVIVHKDRIIARGHNLKEKNNDPTAHAEMIAIKKAAQHLSSWRLNQCQIYVTVEPCPMCAGAIIQARIKYLIFGTADKKTGAAGSLYNLVQDHRLNHQTKIKKGVLAEKSKTLLQNFFKKLRKK